MVTVGDTSTELTGCISIVNLHDVDLTERFARLELLAVSYMFSKYVFVFHLRIRFGKGCVSFTISSFADFGTCIFAPHGYDYGLSPQATTLEQKGE